MNLATLPRLAARWEYAALRAPLTILERHIIAPRLDGEDPVRLRFEKTLGSVDRLAGRLLRDVDLVRRGHALIHRTELLEKAAALEAKAQQRRQEADQQIAMRQAEIAQKQTAAEKDRQGRLNVARRKEQAAKREARRQAHEHAEHERRHVEEQTKTAIEYTDQAQAAELASATDRQIRASAEATKRLNAAGAKRKAAESKRVEADQLATLAASERRVRKAD